MSDPEHFPVPASSKLLRYAAITHPDLPRLAREACEAWDRWLRSDEDGKLWTGLEVGMQRLREVCDD